MRLAIGILVCSLVAMPASAATVFVDDFTEGAMGIADNASGGANVLNAGVPSTLSQTGLPTANVLGGSRTSTIQAVSGSLSNVLDATFTIDLPAPPISPPLAVAGQGVLLNTPASGETVLTLAYPNGVHDLTIDAFGKIGTADTSFITFDFGSSLSLEINIMAQDTGSDIATTTLTTPSPAGPSIDDTVVFSSWTNAANVDFDSIQNLTFEFVARAGSSFQINSISLNTTLPEPSSLGMIIVGLGALVVRRRRSL